MKNLIFAVALIALSAISSQAQRIAVVDVNSVLESIPEYKTAQTELDRVAEQWKQEIEREYKKIDEMYRKYQAEEPLLSETARKQREDEIVAKEKTVRELQKQRFGAEGELFKKRQALVKPIQERVFNAVNAYAKDKGFDFIFDKASTGILFANDTMEKTEDIIKKLGGK